MIPRFQKRIATQNLRSPKNNNGKGEKFQFGEKNLLIRPQKANQQLIRRGVSSIIRVIVPSLLTSDDELQEGIKQHPMLEWKALHVRQHKAA
jgi:hypothetical protein